MMLFELLKELLFPRKCILCGKVLSSQETDLCHGCRADTPEFIPEDRRFPHIYSVCALWYYEKMVRESLLRYKFHNRPGYASGYGPLLALKIAREMNGFNLITWVPVSRKRRKERGYDQSELLARAVSRELGIPVAGTLRKVRDNPAQSGIQDRAKRLENVKDAYAPVEDAAIPGKRVLLIDDILTTGATASECARTLLRAGAEQVSLAVVAAGREKQKDKEYDFHTSDETETVLF